MNYEIINASCWKYLQELEDTQIDTRFDIVVTSPPYKKKDGFDMRPIAAVFAELRDHCKPNALCFVNFGHLAHHKSDPFELALLIQRGGWTWHDTIVWFKHGHYTPLPDPHLNNLWEPIFLFINGDEPKLDRLSIGVPYKDKSNIKRFGRKQDLRCAGNVWLIDYETITSKEQKTHKDRFPVELPRRCIKLAGLQPGSLVYDPFSGSATTGVAALELGMKYIGTEINKKIAVDSTKRLQKIVKGVEDNDQGISSR